MSRSAGPGLPGFARRWASAIAWTSYVPMSREERNTTLEGYARRLADALVAEPFSEQPGYDVGAELVAADFAAPETLGSTIEVIDEHLLDAAGLSEPSGGLTVVEARERLARLLGALATAYSWALRDRTLDEQEAIRAAAFVAREQAERALRESEARFRHAALHDPLTGMTNRALFADRLTQIFSSASPVTRVGLCFIDLDSFKGVNDSLGHQVGDKLLEAVAERLTRLAGELGALAARFGGDEFVLLIENTTGSEEAVKAADLVLSVLAEPFHVEGHNLPMTASIGIVERPIYQTDRADLLRAADMTLQWAKTDGKSRWSVFDEERNAREVARYTLAAAMPAALERGEFTLVYQPIVALPERTLEGVEALARWKHPKFGQLSPSRFIELAEDSGLIVPLGLKLMEDACRQGAQWQSLDAQGPYVSVNLAPRQVHHPGLVADLAAILERTGLRPERLQLEITESAVMGDPETLQRLRDVTGLGVRLAVDDFGTGYSNLANLRSLPVHGLKLAGQFVQDLQSGGPDEFAFVEILVTLGHTLGLAVTAEGVETPEQLEILRSVGCESAQGYFLGMPGPPEHITRRLPGEAQPGQPPRPAPAPPR